MSPMKQAGWGLAMLSQLLLLLQFEVHPSSAANTPGAAPVNPPPFPFPFPSPGISVPKTPYCTTKLAHPNCPQVPTFDFIDLSFFGGNWYEIGSTARSKLQNQAGRICQQTNYTLTSTASIGTGAQLRVLNKAVQITGPVAAFGIQSIGGATRGVCNSAQKLCDLFSPTGQITTTGAQVGAIGFSISLAHPNATLTLQNVTVKITQGGKQIQAALDSVAKNISAIQVLASLISQNTGSRTDDVAQLKTAVSAVRDSLANITVLVSQLDDSRNTILKVAASLLVPVPFADPPFETIGQLWKAATELADQQQTILAKTAKIKFNLATIDVASGLLTVDLTNQTTVVQQVGSAAQNSTSLGKLDLSLPGLFNKSEDTPFWILALDGVPSQGYQSALTFSCIQNGNGDVRKALSIISRNTTLPANVVQGYLSAASSYGFDFDCEDPFILTNQDPSCAATFAESKP